MLLGRDPTFMEEQDASVARSGGIDRIFLTFFLI